MQRMVSGRVTVYGVGTSQTRGHLSANFPYYAWKEKQTKCGSALISDVSVTSVPCQCRPFRISAVRSVSVPSVPCQ
jgi:hypothetical protein